MRDALGTASPLGDLVNPPTSSLYDAEAAKVKREASTTSGDYFGSMVSQDSPIEGWVGSYVGSKFKEDPKYNPYDPATQKALTAGLPEEYHNEFLKARSADHAQYIRMRLDDKMVDLQRLGDLGFTGNAARFVAGLVEPTNLALGLASGGVTSLVRGARTVTAGSRIITDATKAATTGEAVAQAAKGLTVARAAATDALSVPSILSGFGAAGAGGYALERMRQSVNFEDSQHEAVWAGLMGMVFSAPFIGVHALQMRKVRAIAGKELESLNGYYAESQGRPATAEQLAATHEVATAHAKAAEEFMADPAATENLPVKPLEVPTGPTAKAPEEMLHPAVQAASVIDTSPAHVEPVDTSLVGKGVWGTDFSGKVKRVTKDGQLLVIDDTTFLARKVNPADLAHDSPGYKPPAAPEGFLAGSAGSAQVAHVPVELTAMSKARFDIYARLNRSENPVVRQLGDLLVKDAIAKSEFYAQKRTASEDKKVMQRTIAGGFHFAASGAYDAAAQKLGQNIVQRSLPSNVKRFYETAGRALRDPKVFAENAHIAPELKQVVSAMQEVYSTMAGELNRSGVKGAEDLVANPEYANRVWKPEDIRVAAKAHGEETVHRLVAESISDKHAVLEKAKEKQSFKDNPIPDAEILQAHAKKFVDAIMRLEHSHLSTELLLAAKDEGTMRRELDNAGLKPAEIDALITNLFETKEATTKDAGQPTPLKYRFNLDESTRITTPDGKELALTSFMENDPRVLVDRYMNTMGGHVALAKRGIQSRADFMARLKEADADHETQSMTRNGKAFDDEKTMLQDMYDNIVGRPMSVHHFNTGDRVAGVMRAYGRSVYLGQLGFTAMQEAFHAAGLATWGAALKQMPSLGEFWQATRAGHKATTGLAADVRSMLGFLNEHVSGYLRQHEITDFTYDRGLTGVENTANALSHTVDKISGNSFVTSFTRGIAASWMMQKYASFAHGKEMPAKMRERMVGSGINADDIDHTLGRLKEFSDVGAGGKLDGIRWEEWSKADPASYHDFVTAVDRDVRQAIQDHDIGETWMFQHTAIGKVFTELRAFNIASHSKQMLNSVHYRDRMALQLWTTSFVVNALAYMTQTSVNFAHNPAELDKRLTADRIARAAYQRSNMMGILPFITDTVVPGYFSPFQASGQGLTANTDSRNILMPPSFNTIAKGVNFMQNGKPKDGLSVLPFSNTYGARNLVDQIGKSYPQHSTP